MGVYRVGLAAVLFLVGLGVAKVVTSIFAESGNKYFVYHAFLAVSSGLLCSS